MNSRGQVLAIFIILLPIILILFTFVIDLGFLYVEKRNISNNTYDATEYYLKNIDDIDIEEKTKKLLNKNISNIDIKINNNNDYVEITVVKKHKINGIINKEDEIKITYKGIKSTKEIIKG